MIVITDKAVEKIKEIADSGGIDNLSIRVKILGGGCAGYSFDLAFEDAATELDEVFNISEISVIIDPLSAQYMEGIEMDYVDSTFGGGFKFGSGGIKSSCGCGKSVSF